MPTITYVNTSSNVLVRENTTHVQTVQAVDDQGASVSYALSGADAARFAIDATLGTLSFVEAPDYDVPSSAANTNVYQVTVTATSANGSEALAITITVQEDPSVLEKNNDLTAQIAEDVANLELHKADQTAVDQAVSTINESLATKADQTAVDQAVSTINEGLATKASQTSLDATNTNLTNVSNRAGALEAYFVDGVLDLSHLPEELRSGLRPQGIYTPGVTTLPTGNMADHEFKYWIVAAYGQADLSSAQDGTALTDVVPKSWIIGDGVGYAVVGGGDGLSTVNSKTPVNGNVVLTAADMGYTPDAASGLVGTTTKAALDEVGAKLKQQAAAVGDTSTYAPKAAYLAKKAEVIAAG